MTSCRTYTPPKGWTQPGLQTVMQRNGNLFPSLLRANLIQSTANAPPKSTPSPSPPPARSSKAGAIAGGVIGGVVGLALILLAIQVTLRRRRHHLDKYREQQRSQSGKRPGEVPSPTHPIELPGSSWNEHSKNDRPGRSMTEILFSKRRNVDYCNDIQRQNDSGGGIRTGELEGESVAHELDTDPRRSSMF